MSSSLISVKRCRRCWVCTSDIDISIQHYHSDIVKRTVLISALAVLLLAWQISVAIYGIARDGTKTLGCQQTGIELVSEVGHEGKGAHNLTALEKGMTMHTTIIKQKTA